MKPKMISITVAVLLFLIVLIQNTQIVVVKILFWEISMSQVLLIALTLLAGMGTGFTLALLAGYRSGKPKHDGTT